MISNTLREMLDILSNTFSKSFISDLKKAISKECDKAVEKQEIKSLVWVRGTLEVNSYKDTMALINLRLDTLTTPERKTDV